MVDLRADTSIYPKPGQGQMSLMDLLNITRSMRELQTQQAIGAATGKNIDPVTGDLNAPGVRRDLGKAQQEGNAPTLTPEQIQSTSQAEHTQLDTATAQVTTAAKLLAPALALGNKVTRAQVAPILDQAASLHVPPQLLAPVLKAKDGPELANAILNLKQAMVGVEAPAATVPGVAGGPPRTVGAGQAERMGVTGGAAPGAGAPGIASADEPPELKAERAAAGTFQERTAPFINAIASARKLGPNETGGLNEEFKNIKKTIASLGIPGLDMSNVNSYDELKKSLAQIADQQSSGGTNDRLAQAISGTPNVSMRTATISTLAKVAYAIEARRNALYQEFAATNRPSSEFPAWRAKMNSELDPRAFTLGMMSDDARKKFLKDLSPAEHERMQRSRAIARKYILNAPEGGWYLPSDEK